MKYLDAGRLDADEECDRRGENGNGAGEGDEPQQPWAVRQQMQSDRGDQRQQAADEVSDLTDEFLSLDKSELARVAKALKKLRGMDWDTLLKHKGARWEEIGHMEAPNGKPAHSVRLSGKYRALAYREGDYLRVLSLHLDHDSAYEG